MNDDPHIFSEERLKKLKDEANTAHAEVKGDMEKVNALLESFRSVAEDFRNHSAKFAKLVVDIENETHKCKI